jgi:steroid 5-alpha reductase family enzyme
MRRKAFFLIALAYLSAGIVGALVGYAMRELHPLWIALAADLAATVIVFVFSVMLGNSSTYDPYWSIAPAVIALYWAFADPGAANQGIRTSVVLALVGVWSIRLTWNWIRRWGGRADEDWRYADLRARHGHRYWFVSFLGIHLMPTVLVFLGCLPLFPALSAGVRPLGIMDVAATLVTVTAIWIEAQADRELWRFLTADQHDGKFLDTGMWQHFRHPNYLGEMSFWWGLYLFALAADPRYWWTIVGPIAITCLFLFISIPMMERHMLKRRSAGKTQIEITSQVASQRPKGR